MKLSLFGFVGSLLFLVLVLAASGTRTATGTTNSDHSGSMSGMNMGTPTASSPTSDPMTDSLKTMSGKEFEIKFMQYMIVHHQFAIQMAQLVATHTNRPELKTTNPMSVPGMMEMMASMHQLKTAHNATFDKEFLSIMIQHHQEAINMAKLLPSKTQRPQLLTLGQNIIKAQSSEIQQMQTWQKQWFNS